MPTRQTPYIIECCILCATLHTDAQQKAQAELDAIIGSDRLPTLADRPRLPYVEAFFWEIIRKYVIGIGVQSSYFVTVESCA